MSDIDILDPTYQSLDDSPDRQEPELFHPHVAAFVEAVIAQQYRRDVKASREWRWCPQWWRHAEAISRLEALWRAWEFARLDAATGMSNWWPVCDQTMRALMDPGGTFRKCSAHDGHKQMDPLPLDSFPPGLFD